MNEEQFWIQVLANLENNKEVILLVIIDRKGSAPNIPGAKMFVTTDNLQGTVGGGVSENKLVERARTLLKEQTNVVEKIYMEHRETETEYSSGMICSGSQAFALVSLAKSYIPTIKAIVESLTKGKIGLLSINSQGLNFDETAFLLTDNVYREDKTSWTYQENIGIRERIFIIGGGHVSLALSKIMNTLGFFITVIDDRKNLPTMDNNIFANQRLVIPYNEVVSAIQEGNNVYVTIMTFGHTSDEFVLESIIKKNFRYLGMMASSAKKQQIFENLLQKGFSEELLNSVHSPIGVQINSHTPEEIAISIAAEIISIKNTKNEIY